MFQGKTPIYREWKALQKKESKFLKSREEKRENFINRKLAEKVPEKLQNTLDTAFAKAFALIFEKGTGIIEKTYQKDALAKTYQINQYADEVRKNRKTLLAFSKEAKKTKAKNLFLSGVSGISLGVLGIGLPDIPIFTGMILKNIYETALNYGYEYESEPERYYILLLIQGAVSYGPKLKEIDRLINEYIESGAFSCECDIKKQILSTSSSLSKELLYLKFLQGIPIAGAVGGAFDAVYMKRISEYAHLKYRRRFLSARGNAPL